MRTALAVIVDKNNVLIGKVKEEKRNDYGGIAYAFPSAQSEENIKEVLLQEVEMQTGLDVSISDKIGERVHPDTQYLTEYFICNPLSGQKLQVSSDADLEDFRWVDKQEIVKYMPTLFHKVEEYLLR